jgi:hypothetical protein
LESHGNIISQFTAQGRLSFGTLVYELLSGKRAFQGDSAVEAMNAILKEDPPE